MDFENSTEQVEAQSGEQAEVVAPQQSQTEESGEGQESVVGSQRDADFAMVDTGSGEAGDGNPDEPPENPSNPDGAGQESAKQQQTREENAAIRAVRLRAQRDAEAAATAKMDAVIANSGAINPYTKKPFASMKEFLEYGERYRNADIAKKARETGRSVQELTEETENREFVTNLRRQAEARKTVEAAAAKQREFLTNDVMDFVAKYPSFGVEEIAALENNPQFRQFCGTRFGREPLAALYGDYLAVVGNAGAAAVTKAAHRSTRSTGGGTAAGVSLTPAQKAELSKWNEENPDMQMTAKEFLGR